MKKKREEHYYMVGEFARKLGVSRQALYMHIERGEIPTHNVGRYAWIPASELRNWMRVKRGSRHGLMRKDSN